MTCLACGFRGRPIGMSFIVKLLLKFQEALKSSAGWVNVVPSGAVHVGCMFPLLCCSRHFVFGTGCLEFCACLAGSACNGAGTWAVAMKFSCESTPDENLLEKRSLRAGSSPQAGLDFLNGESMIGGWVIRFAAMFFLLLGGRKSIALTSRLAD
jgi:hypothetical protein